MAGWQSARTSRLCLLTNCFHDYTSPFRHVQRGILHLNIIIVPNIKIPITIHNLSFRRTRPSSATHWHWWQCKRITYILQIRYWEITLMLKVKTSDTQHVFWTFEPWGFSVRWSFITQNHHLRTNSVQHTSSHTCVCVSVHGLTGRLLLWPQLCAPTPPIWQRWTWAAITQEREAELCCLL